MTKHVHAEMIKAKADNMDLVVFIKDDFHGELKWRVMINSMPINPDFEYFLCLPQHKEVCLHWLNGGNVEFFECEKWHTINSKITWGYGHLFMSEIFKIRVKPRKEKRWIAKMKGKCLLASNGLYKSLAEASSVCGDCEFYEIEVEI